MRGAGLLLAGLAIASAAGAQPPGPEQALHSYLAGRFRADRADAPDARYVAAFADLDGDGRPEALVYLLGSRYCGTGGCTLLILTPAGRSWRTVTEMTIVNAPVRLLPSAHRGWRDLAVRVSGGGARAHEALIAFNGRTFPSNPSLAPALRRAVAGRVLIADEDRGRPLF